MSETNSCRYIWNKDGYVLEKEALFSGYSCYKGLDWCMLLGISNGCFRLVCIHWKEFIKTNSIVCHVWPFVLPVFYIQCLFNSIRCFLYFILLHYIQVFIFKRVTLEYFHTKSFSLISHEHDMCRYQTPLWMARSIFFNHNLFNARNKKI